MQRAQAKKKSPSTESPKYPPDAKVSHVAAHPLPNGMQGLANSSDPAESARYTGYLTQSVADWFKNARRGSRKTGAFVGNYNGNSNTVFYAEYDWLKILHESLHVTTGLSDDELAAALGVDISKHSGDAQLSSASINKRLKEKGCK